ncbi:MAG: hypothetical protein KJ624_01125 [Chloroflexi bacterium]|nr:hypothetical protein [Chloroflexota bacterium]
MFGWEIGFGVAFLVAGFGFMSAGYICWGIVLLIPGIGLAVTSYLRIHSKVGVGIDLSDFKGEYFQRTNIPSEYQFSGTIEVKVPNAVAVREVYLDILIEGKSIRANLMSDMEGFGEGYTLSPSKPLFKRIAFQLTSTIPIDTPPKQGTLHFMTTDWERTKVVSLKYEAYMHKNR